MMRTSLAPRALAFSLGIFVMSLMFAMFRPALAINTESPSRQRWLLYGADNGADLSLLDADTGTKHVLRTFTSTLISPTGIIPDYSADITLQRLPDGGLLMGGDLNRNREHRIYRLEMPTVRIVPIMDGDLELVLDNGTMIYRAQGADGIWHKFLCDVNRPGIAPIDISSEISPYEHMAIPGARLIDIGKAGQLCIWNSVSNERRCLSGYSVFATSFRSRTNEIIALERDSKEWLLVNADTLAEKRISDAVGLEPTIYKADEDLVYFRRERLGFGKYGFGTIFDLWSFSLESKKKKRVIKSTDVPRSSNKAVWLLDSEVPEAIRKSGER